MRTLSLLSTRTLLRPSWALCRTPAFKPPLHGIAPAHRTLHTFLALPDESTVVASAAAAAAAAPLVGPSAVKFLSVSPALASQVLALSPLQAMRQFREQGSTGAVSIMPYAAMAANGAAWCTYGALASDYTIMIPNAAGLVMGSFYIKEFLTYRSEGAVVAPFLGGGAAFVAAVAGASATLPAASAQTAIGYMGCTLTALMFMGPLAAIKTVLHEQSAAALPLSFTLAATANCTLWTSYGALVIHDPFVYGPNAVGLGFSFVQLALIARFGTSPSSR